MNIVATERALKAKIKALYLARHPAPGVVAEVEGYDALMDRYRGVQRRINNHRRLIQSRLSRRSMVDGVVDQVNRAQAIIARGGILVSFDAERTVVGDLTKEIGVTIYRSDTNTFESHNYRVEGMHLKNRFSYGNTEVMPASDVYEKVRKHVMSADCLVGHALIMDFNHLQRRGVELPKRKYFDTLPMSRALLGFEEGNNLTALAKHFNLAEGFRPHNGGNDARMTMEVFLRMVGWQPEPPPPPPSRLEEARRFFKRLLRQYIR